MMLKIDDEDMKLLQQGSIPEHLAMSEAQGKALLNYIDYLFSKGATREYSAPKGNETIDVAIYLDLVEFSWQYKPKYSFLSDVRYRLMLYYRILTNNDVHIYTVPYGVFLSEPKHDGYRAKTTSLVARHNTRPRVYDFRD